MSSKNNKIITIKFMSSEIKRYQTKTNQELTTFIRCVNTGVKKKITLQEEYKYLNTNVLINIIIYVFKPHCAPKMSCLNKNNPNIPIVKERERTFFKRKYSKCQDVQI